MIYFSEKTDNIVNALETDVQKGLTNKKVEEVREKCGLNELKEAKRKTNFQRFLLQFKDIMILILILAAVISFTVACVEKNIKEFFEPILILLIVVLNAVVGVFQESKAEKALDALKSLSAPHARVIRNGQEEVINAKMLVTGDIIKLEAGDFVPADARLITSSSLKSDESALTGESVAAEKDALAIVKENSPLGDRVNMIYSGCSITYGTATAVVTGVGMNTEMGKIANMLESESENQTPLQQKLSQLGKYLGIIALGCCAIIFVIGIVNKINVLEIFMTAVSLAVSAIPEGLPVIVTIVLSIGVQRMAKKNAIIRRLPAVETLGSASIICSDKTGTLTQNKMTLKKIYISDSDIIEDVSSTNSEIAKKLLIYGTLCSNGSVTFGENGDKHIGDPTETSIVYAAHINGFEKDELNKKYVRVCEIPFDSDRKLMSVIVKNPEKDNFIVIVKGAYDMLSTKTFKIENDKSKTVCDEMSIEALRVLGIAYKEIDKIPQTINPNTIENELKLFGLVGMIDPPRPEAKTAVETCVKAGIKPVMITGDHIVTASAIAKQIGIMGKDDLAITGSELDNMTDSEFDERISQISVYARVSPENKIRIVKAWQRRDQIVSMTGDGVNDAPALKAADIGCAMGITGTDVAKGAADMTLTDDNFATIVDAVKEGRGIYSNIKKVVGFLLGTNIGEIITVFFAMLLWHVTPLLSMQLLWINLVTDSLPAISLGMEAVEKDVMNKLPKPKNEGLFSHGFGIRIILQGFMFGILALVAYKIGENFMGSLAGGQTMAFMVLALSQVVQAYNMRSEQSLFKIGFFGNKTLNKSVLLSIVLVLAVLFIPPISKAFGLIMLVWPLYLIAIGLILVPLIIMECAKAIGLIKHNHSK